VGMAFLHARRNDREAAVTDFCEALSFFEQSGYTLGQAIVWMGLTGKRLTSGDVGGARDALDRGISLLCREYCKTTRRERWALASRSRPWTTRLPKLISASPCRSGHGFENTKAPKKPLELLKALVATGGTAVDIGWLGEQLWPDAEGDAARDAFNVTHSRLRKLLPPDGVLMLSEGKLSLNPAHVWTDVWAFERMVADCLEKLRRAKRSEIESAGETLLSLYSGDLLKGEPDAPWLIAARDRLRSKFLRTLKVLGGFWEAKEAWEQAQSLYERVLEMDNVAEEVYRRSMSCYSRTGRPAEALRVYRRCRQMLSVVLGIAPSVETEALYRSIE
ncbi:MAG: AfsR/SARP family transcriptional regulator, partial [Gammaproteobacteria bacterium]